jgi:Arc/MetJ family transcription regulator
MVFSLKIQLRKHDKAAETAKRRKLQTAETAANSLMRRAVSDRGQQ